MRERTVLLLEAEQSTLQLTGKAVIEAAKEGEEPRRPTFQIDAYSGDPVRVAGFYNPVIVDLAGIKASRPKLPILLDHDHSRIVGMSNDARIGAEGVSLSGTVTGDDADAKKVVDHARNGFEWQASIGASIDRREFLDAGKKATVNGREVTGPMLIAREATLNEVSFVAIGADQKTKANVAATQDTGRTDVDFNQWLQAKGFNPDALDETQKNNMRAMYDAEKKSPQPPLPSPDPNVNLDAVTARYRAEQERVDAVVKIADKAIQENPRGIEAIEAMARMAIEAKWTTERFELELLRGTRPTAALNFRRTEQTNRATGPVIEAALCISGGLPDAHLTKSFNEQTLEAAHKHYPHGIGLKELLLMAANSDGRERHLSVNNLRSVLQAAFQQSELRAGGFSTFSLPGILANTANKFLLMGWMAVDQTWRRISAIGSVSDFKTRTSYSLTGDFKYEKLPADGEIKHGALAELPYTNKADTYARMFAITRQDIINDDLGALTAIPRRLGRGAILALNDIFWAEFLNNSAFWTAGTGSRATGGGSALDAAGAGLTAAEILFSNQTDPDGNPTAIMPSILLVPPSLRSVALTLMQSQSFITGANTTIGNANIWGGRFRVESSPYMENTNFTGASATAWYLLADPNDLPAIEVVFLNGREAPVVETADADFNTLGVQMRGYHDWGVSKQEYRAGVANDGS